MICRRPACTPGCLDTPATELRRGRIGQLAVLTRTLWAVLVSVALIHLLTPGAGSRAERRGAWLLHRRSAAILRALGITVHTRGTPREGGALVVGNHQSFLDILVMSAQTPLHQIAKTEVGDWPLVGGLATRTGTRFLDRSALSTLPLLVDDAVALLRSGRKVQAFPEATTRCGGAIDEFHRCVFQAAIDAAVVVAPVTVQYTGPDGSPVNAPAFVGDETLADSLRRVLALRGLTVQVNWLSPIPAIAGTGHRATDRRRLTTLVQDAVARDLQVPVVWRSGRRLADVPTTRVGAYAGA